MGCLLEVMSIAYAMDVRGDMLYFLHAIIHCTFVYV